MSASRFVLGHNNMALGTIEEDMAVGAKELTRSAPIFRSCRPDKQHSDPPKNGMTGDLLTQAPDWSHLPSTLPEASPESLQGGGANRRDATAVPQHHQKIAARQQQQCALEPNSASQDHNRRWTRITEAEHRVTKQKEISLITKATRSAEQVDLCFILDCTGSMLRHIISVKDNITNIVARVRRTNCALAVRLAVVAYRDFEDAQRIETLDFTNDVTAFRSFVGELQAYGGGDKAEDMATAIADANKLSWESPTRVLFLIADAPCHGRKFHPLCFRSDRHPTEGQTIMEDLRTLQDNKTPKGSMTLFFGRITRFTDKMIRIFKENGVQIDVVSLESASIFADLVTKAVRTSITKTMSTFNGRTGRSAFGASPPHNQQQQRGGFSTASKVVPDLKDYRVVKRAPWFGGWWKRLAPVHVRFYKSEKHECVADMIRRPAAVQPVHWWVDGTMLMRRAPNPFAEGEVRLAYAGQLAPSVADFVSKKGRDVVLKAFKHVGNGLNDLDQYFKQMEVSNFASFLANEYNNSSARLSKNLGRVTVLDAFVLEESTDDKEKSGERRFCVEEPLPDGQFIKFSNNTGYWDEAHLDPTLLRFTLFTYEVTGGYLVVSDLQGIKQPGNDYVLTDPAILCKDIVRFGNTNLGPAFMKRCVESTRAHLLENHWNDNDG